MTPPVIVCGPGRCGTSATAGVLRHLGVYMGERFQAPHAKANPWGSFEDLDFTDADRGLLLRTLSERLWARQIGAHIGVRRLTWDSWGFKDPMIARLLDAYCKLIPDAVFIRCKRDIEAVKASCARVPWTDLVGLGGWAPADQELEERDRIIAEYLGQMDSGRVLELDWENFLMAPAFNVRRIQQFLGLECSPEQIEAAVKSIHT